MIQIQSIASISPAGYDDASVIESYKNARPRFTTHERSGLPVGRLSAEAESALESVKLDPRYSKLDRTVHLAIFAARQAVQHLHEPLKLPAFVNFASSRGATSTVERSIIEYEKTGKVRPHTSPLTTLGNISAWVANDLKLYGAYFDHSMTCSSSHLSLLNAVAWLRSDMAQCCIVGGAEAPLTDFTLEMMQSMGIYSKIPAECRPCRPFEKDHQSGLVISEGSGAIILTKPDDSKQHGAIYISAVGTANESFTSGSDITKDGVNLYTAMMNCLKQVKTDIEMIIPHAPGTNHGDEAEWNAIHRVFGSSKPEILSNKPIIGHTLGAAGVLGIEYAFHLMTGRLKGSSTPKTVMINTAGFGGTAVSIVLSQGLVPHSIS